MGSSFLCVGKGRALLINALRLQSAKVWFCLSGAAHTTGQALILPRYPLIHLPNRSMNPQKRSIHPCIRSMNFAFRSIFQVNRSMSILAISSINLWT